MQRSCESKTAWGHDSVARTAEQMSKGRGMDGARASLQGSLRLKFALLPGRRAKARQLVTARRGGQVILRETW